MKAKLVAAALLLSACSDVQNNTPSLQSYGALQPVCFIFCKATVSSAELAEGSTHNITHEGSNVGGLQ